MMEENLLLGKNLLQLADIQGNFPLAREILPGLPVYHPTEDVGSLLQGLPVSLNTLNQLFK